MICHGGTFRGDRLPRGARRLGWASSIILFGLSSCAGMAPAPSGSAALNQFRRAESMFDRAMYPEAVREYHAVAAQYPDDPLAGQALYEAAYAQIYYKNPDVDYGSAVKDFQNLVQKYPDSAWRGRAQNWLNFLGQLETLKMEKEKLKNDLQKLLDLDMELEKKRRELK